MATRDDYFRLLGQMAAVRTELANRLASERPGDPNTRDMLGDQLGNLEHDLQGLLADDSPMPGDGGIGAVLGIGPGAAAGFGGVPTPLGLPNYHDAVAAERLYALGDLYYSFQFERLGIFRAVKTLQELFRAGTLRLANGEGALGLYRFDRKEVLRYTEQERKQAYRRVFGYTDTAPPRGASANQAFHALFSQFNLRVAELFRDKRIAETFRPGSGATDPSFGSIAVVRRAARDLRANLKRASYGDVSLLTIELLQLISQAYDILNAPDIRHQFGTDDGFETLEEVIQRYIGEIPVVSQRASMATSGRDIIYWLAQDFLEVPSRVAFEALVQNIAEKAEEWMTSAQSLGAMRTGGDRAAGAGNIIEFPSRSRSSGRI